MEKGWWVDEIPRIAYDDGDKEGQDGEYENSQSRNCKNPRVKTRVARTVRPSKKKASTDCTSPSE